MLNTTSDEPIVVLLVEDSETDALWIKAQLESHARASFVLLRETTCAGGVSRLAHERVDIVVLDLTLPDSSGIDTFVAIENVADRVPVVILSGITDDKIALEAVRRGAQNFFSKKEVLSESLGRLLQYTIERFHRQLADRDIESAGLVQRRLFPKHLPQIPGFDVAGHCEPANHVGGDYYDYFVVGDDRLFLVVGDVCGHGFGPSLVMAETRAAIRTMAATTGEVLPIIEQSNRLVHDDEVHWFVTLFLACIDLPSRVVQYVSAGHPGDVYRGDGSWVTLNSGDLPLGIRPGADFNVQSFQLMSADTLVLYTDGIIERLSPEGESFGISRIRQSVSQSRQASAEATIERLFHAAAFFAEDRPSIDDMTAVALKLG